MNCKLQLLNSLFEQIHDRGIAIIEMPIEETHVLKLKEMAFQLYEQEEMEKAKIGRANQKHQVEKIRGDQISWIDNWSEDPALLAYKQFIDSIRERANYELFLALKSFEAHFAAYPEGAFYRRHIDQHQLTKHRQLSCILYLSDWREDYKGELMVYLEKEELKIAPQLGRFVCFISKDLEHEVLETKHLRLSLSGWIRDDEFLF